MQSRSRNFAEFSTKSRGSWSGNKQLEYWAIMKFLDCFNSVHFWCDHSGGNRWRFYVALHITRDYFRMTNLIKRGVSVTGMPDPIRSGMY